jgi:steroid delta-isomerase-like uncharacterized protein
MVVVRDYDYPPSERSPVVFRRLKPVEQEGSMSEDLKAIARREVELFSTGDMSIAEEIYADDYVGHDPAKPEPIRGVAAAKDEAAGHRAAFSDLTLPIDHQVAEGEYVVTRWTARGTHDGDLDGIAATGVSSTTTGMSMIRVVDGKIVEDYTEWDALGLMTQLGVVPAMA